MTDSESPPKFVVCVRNDGFEASLAVRKLYRTLPDQEAGRRSLLRIVDESGEDYLYPADLFAAVTVTAEAAEELAAS